MDQRLPDPAGAAPPDWRGLCEELISLVERCPVTSDTDWIADRNDLIVRFHAARPPALAQPEPEVVGLTDEELDAWITECADATRYGPLEHYWAFDVQFDHVRDIAHAVLSRWGRPAPAPAGEVAELVDELRTMAGQAAEACQFSDAESLSRAADLLERQAAPVPVAVSEMPWEREGWCHPQERWAWFYSRRVGWRDAIPPESLKPPTLFPYAYSVPYDALPLPGGEVGHD